MKRVKGDRKQKRWKLRDLVDLEILLKDSAPWRNAWRKAGIHQELAAAQIDTEKQKRQLGLRWTLDEVREKKPELAGGRVDTGAKMIQAAVFLIMLLIGIGVMRGLLSHDRELSDYSYNIWVLLAVSLGLQWLFIVIGFLSYWLWRRWAGSLTIFQTLISEAVKKWGKGSVNAETWSRLMTGGFKKVWGWRLTRILQAGGIGYNIGLMVALFGCLWFFNIRFYWESTIPQFGGDTLLKLTGVLDPFFNVISDQAVADAKLGNEALVTDNNFAWGKFFLIGLLVWGLLPRCIFWVMSCIFESKELAQLDFQEPQHRSLWRDMTKVQRGEVSAAPADGAVVLDLGGLETTNESLRPYLLQVLRVNPETRYSLGTLDPDADNRAFAAAKAAASGVVFLVEGWNLSPKRMEIFHDQLRSAIGEASMIRYLVLGNDEEMLQWTQFVDQLKDAETEIFQYPQVTSQTP